MPSCPCCARKFRSHAAYELFLARKRVRADLEEYVAQLRAGRAMVEILSTPSKIQRHRADAESHRAGMA